MDIKIKIILYLTFLITLKMTFIGCASNKNTKIEYSNLTSTIYAEYDVYFKPRKLILKTNGILLKNSEISQFSWSFGKEGFVEFNENGIADAYYQDEIGNVVLKDFINKKILHREIFITKPYLLERDLEKINWEITNENKQIGDFKATLAKCSFNGREYEAWFTPEIPFNDGPWKFHGLPGLILEVTDSKNEYSYVLSRVVFDSNLKPIKKINKSNKVDLITFYKGYEIESKDLQSKILSKSDGEIDFNVSIIQYNPQEIISNNKLVN